MFCELSELHNESDVEQKFLTPLLSGPIPQGLAFPTNSIVTKERLVTKIIDKGKKSISYAPDYLILIEGIPFVVVEAKHPEESVEEGYRQAQLYAQVINNAFPHETNPCNKIIACNGKKLLAGYYDSDYYEINMDFADFFVGNDSLQKLQRFLQYDLILEESKSYFKKLRTNSLFIKPISQVGSRRVQNEEVLPNSFGANLAFNFQHVFTPDSEEEKLAIVENAYVFVKRREHHADPIYKTIKKDITLTQAQHLVVDTESPKEFSEGIKRASLSLISAGRKKALILLIGSVGSGKSTFIRHFQYQAFPKEELEKTVWLYIDMNSAKNSIKGDFDWIAERIYDSLKLKYPQEAFESLEMMLQVYKKDVQDFENGFGKLLKNTEQYNTELYKIIKEIHSNPEKRLKKYMNFFCDKYKKTHIVVLDNCDKKTAEEQLIMFDVAQWLREYFPFLVIMPLRDSTYDTYQNTPPLDTVIKDLTFRIDPPDFLTVLQYRLNYIFRLQKDALQVKGYDLLANKHVELKKDEFINYFRSILNAIRNDPFAKDIFYGLANRNIRRGIEIFLNFCQSGHILAEHFLKMRVTDGSYTLRPYLLLNALMRGNRKYYSSEVSCIKNIFSAEYSDTPPDPFIRLDILSYLNVVSSQKNKRVITVRSLVDKLLIVSHRESVIKRELTQLIQDGLVSYESNDSNFEENGQVSISVAGRQHLRLLHNINYLSACSEDVYYQDTNLAVQIAERMKYQSAGDKPLSSTYLNAKDLVNYLENYKKNVFAPVNALPEKESQELSALLDLTACHDMIAGFEQKNSYILDQLHPKGDISLLGQDIPFKVTHITEHGIFGYLEGEIKGFLPRKTLADDDFLEFDVGVVVQVRVVDFSSQHGRFTLKFLKFIES